MMRNVFDFCCVSALHLLFIRVCLNPQRSVELFQTKPPPRTVCAGVEASVFKLKGQSELADFHLSVDCEALKFLSSSFESSP